MTSIAVIIVLAPCCSSRYGGYATRRVGRCASDWRGVILIFSALHIAGMVGLRKFRDVAGRRFYDFRFSVATLIYDSGKT